MTENPTHEPRPDDKNAGPLYAPESSFSLFIKLFIVPALIVAIALGIFLLGTLALQHPKSAEQYLEELRSDSTSRRWQAAYELSRMLNQGEKIQFDENLRSELVKTFEGAKSDDPRVREYLALVLGRLKEKSAVPALSDAAHDESADVKIYSLWALGNIEDPAGGPAALSALSDSDPQVQIIAVGALSAMRYGPAKGTLENYLESSNSDLKYDSAVALARLKDDKAVPILLDMLSLTATGQADKDPTIQSVKLAAIDGATEFTNGTLHQKLLDLSRKDPDLKVREAAMEALKK